MAKAKAPKPTATTYSAFQVAFDHFNSELFGKSLSSCLITLQRKAGSYGFFCSKRFAEMQGDKYTDEIALNPRHFREMSVEDIASVLAHEMAHLWQYHHGKPGRGRYHNSEWARKMLDIGLLPISIDHPGKMTGQKVTHEIMPGGPFALSFAKLAATGFTLDWGDAVEDEQSGGRGRSRIKYTCGSCGTNIWGRPGIVALCFACEGAPMFVAQTKGATCPIGPDGEPVRALVELKAAA